jgi:nucleoside-diphosphate-sugar epimerase
VRVLVTGASSLLGAETLRRLAAAGHDTRSFQRRPSGLATDEVLGDVADPVAAAAAVRGIDTVVHLAARVGAVGPWAEYERTNVHGTATLIDGARTAGVRRFVYVSSPSVAHAGSSLVGASAGPADPATARGSYARSKALAEIRALQAADRGFSVVVARPHLVWGPGDTQLVGRIVDRAERGRMALVGSGTALIDTTYVDNAADALVAAAERADGLGGRSFVISNGQPRPIAEILNRIARAAGLQPIRRSVPTLVALGGGFVAERAWAYLQRRDEPPMTRFVAEQLSTAHWFDQRATRRALGWEPAVSIDEGFLRLEAWFADRRATNQA